MANRWRVEQTYQTYVDCDRCHRPMDVYYSNGITAECSTCHDRRIRRNADARAIRAVATQGRCVTCLHCAPDGYCSVWRGVADDTFCGAWKAHTDRIPGRCAECRRYDCQDGYCFVWGSGNVAEDGFCDAWEPEADPIS